MGFPTFARGVVPSTSNGRLELLGTNRPVTFEGEVVEAGWFGAADANGLLFFPSEHSEAVLAEARRLVAHEIAQLAAIRAGVDPIEALLGNEASSA